MPKFLSKEAQKVWRRLTTLLRRRGTIRPEDQMQMTALCVAFDLLSDCSTQYQTLPKESRAIVRNGTGGFKPNPLLAIIESQSMIINSISRDFGLNPISRARLEETEDGIPLPPRGSRTIADMVKPDGEPQPRVRIN